MIRYRASWVVPIARPPVRNGWVAVDQGRIVSVGSDRGSGGREVDLGDAAILPGLVNAHTHLELSYLRGRVAVASSFVDWIRDLVSSRNRDGGARSPEVVSGIEEGIAEALRCGTALVGDISNTLATFDALARSELGGVVFHELIRFNAPEPELLVERALVTLDALGSTPRLRCSLAAHAPYSVAPELFTAIRKALDRRPAVPTSVHLSESVEELEFIASGTGPWRRFLEEVNAWSVAWAAPGVTPVEYLDGLGFLDARVLVVHGVQMRPVDLARLAARGATLVACPRSNARTGAGNPPLKAFYDSGVRVAVGTDSLASTPDLSVLAELAAIRALAPDVPASSLLDSATRQGARALGFESDYGTLETGKRARALAVAVPANLTDVEEYLVSGVEPGQLRWIDA